MYKQKRKQKNSGITLIALVLTIIVLLILAGVVLSLALGQNGLVFKARETKQEQEIAQEKDRIMTAYGATFVHKNGKYDESRFKDNLIKEGIFSTDDKLTTISNSPLKIELVRKHDGYTVTYTLEDGAIKYEKLADNTTTNNTIPKDLQVGDTIIYDPTKGVTDTSKLSYTSVKGTAKTGGNGYGTQKVTAKSTNNEWVVISTANNQIKVMAKNPIGDIEGGDVNLFTFKSGIGWLYVEEELHKACSIYGHGKGTVKTITTYKVGNYQVPGEAKTRTLTGSGARSMTMEDIVKIMKGDQYSNFTDAEKKKFYSDEALNSNTKRYYPTITSDEENAISKNIQKFNNDIFAIDLAAYDEDLVTDQQVKANKAKLKAEIFKTHDYDYYIAHRCVHYAHGSDMGDNVKFNVMGVREDGLFPLGGYDYLICVGNWINEDKVVNFLRPIVYLDGSMLEKQSDGVWKIK